MPRVTALAGYPQHNLECLDARLLFCCHHITFESTDVLSKAVVDGSAMTVEDEEFLPSP